MKVFLASLGLALVPSLGVVVLLLYLFKEVALCSA
jgi:hypothetical protein